MAIKDTLLMSNFRARVFKMNGQWLVNIGPIVYRVGSWHDAIIAATTGLVIPTEAQ
jgi:hypothetical protein